MTISGQVPAAEPEAAPEGAAPEGAAPSEAAEHDWATASPHVFPALRPPGTQGVQLSTLDPEHLSHEGTKQHAHAVLDPGPADLVVAYVLRTAAFDIVVNADHLLTWGIAPEALRETAMRNLREWSSTAPWTDELAGDRHLLSSDTGAGGDAARILLAEVRQHLAGACGGPARVLVALPDRDLLIAASLNPDDDEFASQLAAFVMDVSEGAHEPIDRRLFELTGEGHELVPFVA